MKHVILMTQIDGEPEIAPAALGAIIRGDRKTKGREVLRAR